LQGLVVSLETLRRDAVGRGGGKGANLDGLLAAELDVPPGFCVTTAVYRRALVEAGLAEAIDKALRDVRADDPGWAEAALARE
jgi:pyruvate,water dikinase